MDLKAIEEAAEEEARKKGIVQSVWRNAVELDARPAGLFFVGGKSVEVFYYEDYPNDLLFWQDVNAAIREASADNK